MLYFNFALAIWYLIYICYTIYLYLNCSVPYDSNIKGPITKAPRFINPAALSILFYNKITPEVLTSTILILIKRGSLIIKMNEGQSYIYKPSHDISTSDSQRIIVDLLIDTIGNGEKVSIKQIHDFCNNNHNSTDFLNDYYIWKKVIYKEIMKNTYFEPKTVYIHIKDIRLLGIILFVLNIILGYHTILGYFVIIPAFALMAYFKNVYKRTRKANDEYHKWLEYKKYLKTFNNEDDKETLWSLYIYGLIIKADIKNNSSKFILDLNNAVKRCFIRANLYGNRSLFKK
ncbi:MAG: DUF2207 domain-containing protein [Bacilli bacterium]|nr:DUF2207 domain-containing protein [Bacilli bacterium]